MPMRRLLALALLVTAARTAAAQTTDPAKPTAPAAPAAGAPAAVPDIDPVGSYLVNLTAQGNAMALTAKIEKKTDGTGFTGSVMSDAFPPMPINAVRVAGNKISISVSAPDGSEAVINLEVKGTDLVGEWSMANDGSKVTGKKLP